MRIRGMILFALIAVTGRTLLAVPTATVTKLTVTAGSVSTNAVAAGTVVTLSATVKVGTASVKPGLVRFCDASINAYCQGLANLGSAQIVSSTGKAALNVRLGLGTHMITAVFAGTSSYKGSVSAASSLEVQGSALSATTLTVTPTDATGSYSLAATVTSIGAGALGWPATGTVTFPDAGNGGKSLGSATLAAGSDDYGMGFLETWSLQRSVQATGDWNGDGNADIVAEYAYQGGSYWYTKVGDGNGSFNGVYELPTLPGGTSYYSVPAVADFNGDGVADLLVVLATGANTGPPVYSWAVLLGNGDGTFAGGTATGATSTVNGGPITPLVGDFDGDGWPDVLSQSYSNLEFETETLNFYAGKGTGAFAAPVSLGTGLPSAETADLNGDGKLDLIGGDPNNDAVVAIGNGDGSFQTPVTSTPPYFGNLYPANVILADFNGDGILDIGGTDGNFAYISYGNGDGTFGAPNSTPLLGSAGDGGGGPLYSADLNGDGLPDLMSLEGGSDRGYFYLNNGDGTFAISGPINLAGGPTGIDAAVDLNGDGLPDLLVDIEGYSEALVNTGGWVSQAVLPGVTFATGSGKHLIKASFGGDTGTLASSSSESAPLWAPKISTALTLSASATTLAPGGSVKLTATLTPSTSGSYSANGELVGFYSGSTLLGSAALANGVATLTTTSLPGGADAVKAEYSGDNSFSGAASAPVAVTVTQTSTTLTLAASTNATTAYASPGVTLTATLSPYSKAALKTDGELVTFYDGKTVLGTGVLASGVATAIVTLPVGSQALTAIYAGDLNFAASTSAVQTVTVTKAATTLTLTPGLTTVGVGNAISLTATVTPVNAAAYPYFYYDLTYESVYFYQGKVLLGVGLLYPGTTYGSATAQIATTALPLGTDTLTAVYTGDSNFTGVTSAAQTVTVTKDATTLMMGLAYGCENQGCTFAYPGESVTVTATMSGSNNNGFPYGEKVKFLSGTTVLGTGTLSNVYVDGCSGTPCATFTTSALPAGNVKLTAQYAGDAVFAAENSAALIVPVAKMPTTTVVSASSSTGIPGTSVTLTAFVSPSNATDGFFYNETYGETVSFYAGSKLLGTAQLIQAQYPGLGAQLTTTAIPTGSNAITAVYGGDEAYLKSTSAAVNVSLSKIATTSMLTPTTLGDCGTYVTLTMQVTSSIPSDPNFASYGVNDTATYYTTTGIKLGTSPLTYISSIPGQVSEDFITKTLPCGGVSVYAVYSGDGLYAGSTSPTRYINLGPPPVIVWPGPAPVKEGTPLTAKQLNATMTVAGTFTYSPAPGTVLPKGTHTLTTTFKPSVKAMREGYAESSKSVTLKVE